MANIAPQPKLQFFDANGHPLVGGKLYSYQAGTTTPLSTYTDSSGSTLNTNPIVLDSRGEASVWLGSQSYKLKLTTSTDVEVWTVDNISSAATLAQLAASNGAGLIGFIQDETDAVATTVLAKLQDYISVHDFMTEAQIADSQSGTPTLDMTAAVQAAISTNKSVYFPQGVYLVDEIVIPTAARGSTYYGDGFYHYNNNQKTVIKARTLGQASIFRLSSGADNITFSLMRIEGDNKADKCVDAAFGAFLTFVECGVYNGVSYGVYSKQGLMRIDRCFMAGSNIQCHMWSDSAATDSEFTGGAICLLLAAGGNRLVNIWANSGTSACVSLRPFDNSTNHINTSIVNLYAGETYGINRPVVDIVGTGANRVQQVHISNSFIVTAVASPNKIDGGVYMEYVTDVSINNVQFRGVGVGYTPTSYTPFSVYGGDNVDGLTINACTFRDINRNPIYLNSNIGSVNITGCSFQNWDIDQNATGGEAAALRITTGRVSATGNNFFISGGQTQPYIADVANANMLVFDNNYSAMPTPTIVTGTGIVSGFNRSSTGSAYVGKNVEIYDSIIGDSTVNNAGRNYLQTDAIASAGSGVAETLNLTTLANTAQQQVYIATASQQGGSSNTVMYMLNVYGGSAKAVRVAGDTASPGANALDFQFTGLQLQLVVGSGFGVVTWRWAITRLV